MVTLQKLLCLLFTLLVLYIVSQHCTVEGLQIGAFDNCLDDPEWFTTDKAGKKHMCRDIGKTASCYDINNKTGQEGWERCLKSCGNCAKGKVTNSQQDNLAFYSGDPVQDYGMVLFTDDERKWVGLDTGKDGKKDVRGTITTNQAESINDIYDRLKPMEGLYDMLLGSVSTCLDCEKFTSTECQNHLDKCVVTNGLCVPKVPKGSPAKFTSCNGSELSCDYKIKEPMSKGKVKSGKKPSSIKLVDGEDAKHTYVKHQCDNNGDCSLMFPTVEFNCKQLPQPQNVTGNLPEIVYAPAELSTRKCITKSYLASTNSNIVSSSDPTRQCTTQTPVSATPGLTIPITSNDGINATIPPANQANFPWTASIKDSNGNMTTPGTSVSIEPLDPNNQAQVTACGGLSNVVVNEINTPKNTFTLTNTTSGQVSDLSLSNLSGACHVRQDAIPVSGQTTNSSPIPNCNKLTANEVTDSNNNDISRVSCANLCNSIDNTVKYISVDGDKCYCYKQDPGGKDSYQAPTTKKSTGKNVTECPATQSGTNAASLEIIDEGRSLQMASVPMIGSNPDKEMRDMCKSYFLVEKSLTGQDVQNMKTTGGKTQTGNQDKGMSERISLYDVCPKQCKAQGCPIK